MYYEDIFKALKEKRVRYLVVGGIAMSLYGHPHSTADLDIMIDLTKANIDRFISAVESLGFKPKAPVSLESFADPQMREAWASEKNMIVLCLYNPKEPLEEVDIFIKNPIDFKKAYRNKSDNNIGEIDITVVSIDDLIKLKEISGRKHDMADIPMLKKIKSAYKT